MTKFEEIIVSIGEELKQLEKINKELARENNDLREQLNKITSSGVSVDEAFRSISSKHNDEKSIGRAYNAVKKHGYENICDLQGVAFYEWRGVGNQTATVIAIILEHYGIKPATPISGLNYMNSLAYARRNDYYFK